MEWDALRGELRVLGRVQAGWFSVAGQTRRGCGLCRRSSHSSAARLKTRSRAWRQMVAPSQVLSKVVRTTHPVRWFCLLHTLDVHNLSFRLKTTNQAKTKSETGRFRRGGVAMLNSAPRSRWSETVLPLLKGTEQRLRSQGTLSNQLITLSPGCLLSCFVQAPLTVEPQIRILDSSRARTLCGPRASADFFLMEVFCSQLRLSLPND